MNVTDVSNKVLLGKGGKHRTTNETVHTLSAKDVLLGRGHHVRQEGNHDFVLLVRANAEEYTSCTRQGGKDAIARRIVRYIKDKGGRFLRQKSQSRDGLSANGSDESAHAWEIADKKTVLIKVKQTFRDYSASLRKEAARGDGEGRTNIDRAVSTLATHEPAEKPYVGDATIDPSSNEPLMPVEATVPIAAGPVAGENLDLANRDQWIQLLNDAQQQLYQQHQRQQLTALVASLASRSQPPLTTPHGAPLLYNNVAYPPVHAVAYGYPSTLPESYSWPFGVYPSPLSHGNSLPAANVNTLLYQGPTNNPSNQAATLQLLALLQASGNHANTRQSP